MNILLGFPTRKCIQFILFIKKISQASNKKKKKIIFYATEPHNTIDFH